MKVELQSKFTVANCNNNKHKLFVFGDNFKRVGKAGQSVIRDCSNSFGIATKYYPSMDNGAFFNDNPIDYIRIKNEFEKLFIFFLTNDYDILVFPKSGLGTGLAKLHEKSPKILKYINNIIGQLYNG